MALVVDSSAVLSVLLREPTREAILVITAGEDLISPASLTWEIGNAFSSLFKRKKMTFAEAQQALGDFPAMQIAQEPVSLADALRISSALNVYAYDAYMIATAQTFNCPLLTLDGGLKYAARQAGVRILEVRP